MKRTAGGTLIRALQNADSIPVDSLSEPMFRASPEERLAVGLARDGAAEERHGLEVALRLRTLLQRPLPDDELAANTRMVATPLEERDQLDASLLIVNLGQERLALDVGFARRVVPMRTVHRVPHRTNELFAGLCNIQGELLPVARLDKLLGIVVTDRAGHSPSAHQRMVVVGEASAAWAVIVDRVEGIRRFDSSTFIAPPATVARALDGVTDALVPLDASNHAARLQPAKLAAALGRCLT